MRSNTLNYVDEIHFSDDHDVRAIEQQLSKPCAFNNLSKYR